MDSVTIASLLRSMMLNSIDSYSTYQEPEYQKVFYFKKSKIKNKSQTNWFIIRYIINAFSFTAMIYIYVFSIVALDIDNFSRDNFLKYKQGLET